MSPSADFFQFPHPDCPHHNHPVYCNYPRFPRRSVGRKSEQQERKQHEDNRQKYHTILSRSYLYTGKIPEYHRQIHPRHPHLHRMAGNAGTERHHQKSSHKNAKTKCEYVSFVFLFKDIEKMSRKLYNNRDKKESIAMANGIYIEIKKRILDAEEGSIFVTSDFTDIATTTTVRKCLGRQVEEKNIRRIIDGVYEKPVYSNLLREYVPANPEKVAYAIARGFHWTIAPCGDVALNKLGLSTQVPVVWSYISDGPYRKFSWDNITLSFKHRANREISYMSETTTLVVEALKTLGKDRVDDGIILSLRNRLPREEKKKMLVEATGVSEWIYTVIRKVCAE